MDNSWLLQNAFYNLNFSRKQPNKNTFVHLTPGFYGINERHHTISVEELFPRGTFITKEAFEDKIEARIVQLNYNNLKSHIKSKIGQYKTYQAVPLRCKQRKGTHPTIRSLMVKNKSGSGAYRRILSRSDTSMTLRTQQHRGKNWMTLQSHQVL